MDLRPFSYKEGNFKILSNHYEEVCNEIIEQRLRLEEFIKRHPVFAESLSPVRAGRLGYSIPPIAAQMIEASRKTGVGPMAAVAGTFAGMACKKGMELGDSGTVVENGGDISAAGDISLNLGIYAPNSSLSGKTAFKITPELLPLGICSSSGTMGHSFSSGSCDLATVFSPDPSLADAAATLAANLVGSDADLEPAAERILGIDGISGVFLVLGDKIAMAGNVPPIIAVSEPHLETKVTKDVFSFPFYHSS